MSTDSPSSPSSRLFVWLGYLSAIAIATMVAAVYWIKLQEGQWPLSHPSSGISLTLLALLSAALPRLAATRTQPLRRIGGLILSAGMAVLGLYSTVLWVKANLMLD